MTDEDSLKWLVGILERRRRVYDARMDARAMFLDTITDLGHRIAGRPSEYDLTQAGGLIRRLCIDSPRLVDRVNSQHKLRLAFVVAETSTMQEVMFAEGAPALFTEGDGLDPDTSPRAFTLSLGMRGFLETRIVWVEPHWYSVADVVRYLSHVQGGVHAGYPNDERDEALERSGAFLRLAGYPPAAHSVRAIGRVLLKGPGAPASGGPSGPQRRTVHC